MLLRIILFLLLAGPALANGIRVDVHAFAKGDGDTYADRMLVSWPGSGRPYGGTVAPPPPVCSGTNFFVSAAGNDSNNGQTTSTPWATIPKVNAPGFSFTAGMCINFRGGDNFNGCPVFSTSTNLASTAALTPIVVQSYGTGNAQITSTSACSIPGISNDKVGAIMIDGGGAALTGFTIQNITLRNGSTTPNGIVIQSSGNQTSSFITVQNMDIGGFATPNNNNYFGAEIVVLGSPNHPGGCGNLTSLTIQNNTLGGTSPTSPDSIGVFFNGLCGAVTNSRIVGNYIRNLGGVQNSTVGAIGIDGQSDISLVSGILIAHNLIERIGANANSCGGPSGIELANTQNNWVMYNNVRRVEPTSITQAQDHGGNGCDWDGIDLDGSAVNNIVAYNLTDHNFSAGYLMFGAPGGSGVQWGPNEVHDNISEDDYAGWKNDYWAAVVFGGKDTGNITHFYNNTISKPTTTGPAVSWVDGNPPAAGTTFESNIISVQSGQVLGKCNGTDPRAATTFKANGYYTGGGAFTMGNNCSGAPASLAAWQASVNGNDTGAKFTNPLFVGPIPATPCTWTPSQQTGPQPCPAGYQLSAASTFIGTGFAVPSSGRTDYYLNPTPNGVGTGYNIGAYGGTATSPTTVRITAGATTCDLLISSETSEGTFTLGAPYNISQAWFNVPPTPCLTSLLPGLVIKHRPDVGNSRQELVMEMSAAQDPTGTVGSNWTDLGAYTVSLLNGFGAVIPMMYGDGTVPSGGVGSAPFHYVYSRWRMMTSVRPVVQTPAAIAANGLTPLYSNLGAPINTTWGFVPTIPYSPMCGCGVDFTGNTGGRFEIGLFPEYASQYLAIQDANSLKAMRLAAEAVASTGISVRDFTGQLFNMDTFPDWQAGGGGPHWGPGSTQGSFPPQLEFNHMGSFSYIPFLLTGDPFDLEQLQIMYNSNVQIQRVNGPGSGVIMTMGGQQQRGMAWVLRELASATLATGLPTSIPSTMLPQSQLLSKMKNNRATFVDAFINGIIPAAANFHVLWCSDAFCDGGGFEEQYLAQVMGFIVWAGFSDWQTILDFHEYAEYSIGNGISGWGHDQPGGSYGAYYHTKFGDTNLSAFTSWTDAWDKAVHPPQGSFTGSVANVTNATFNGTISGGNLHVNSGLSGTLAIGQFITGAGVHNNTYSHTPGGADQTWITGGSGSDWTVSFGQNIGPVAMTAVSPTLTVPGSVTGILAGSNSLTLFGSGIPPPISQFTSGPLIASGSGTTWLLDSLVGGSIPSEAMQTALGTSSGPWSVIANQVIYGWTGGPGAVTQVSDFDLNLGHPFVTLVAGGGGGYQPIYNAAMRGYAALGHSSDLNPIIANSLYTVNKYSAFEYSYNFTSRTPVTIPSATTDVNYFNMLHDIGAGNTFVTFTQGTIEYLIETGSQLLLGGIGSDNTFANVGGNTLLVVWNSGQIYVKGTAGHVITSDAKTWDMACMCFLP